MSVSMGYLPCLKKEEAKILLSDMKKSGLKKGIFKDCGKELEKIIKKEGL